MFCGACGSENRPDSRFCKSCGAQLALAPAVPLTPPSPAPVQAERLAGLGDRFLAVVLDTILLGAAFAAAGMAVATKLGGVTESGFSVTGTPALVSIGVTLLAGFLYTWLSEGLFGATLGKAMVGIRVRRKDGSPCGLGPSLVRNLLRIIDFVVVYLVGLITALLSKFRRRVGDHVAGTVVVERAGARGVRAVSAAFWVLLIVVGVMGAYKLHRSAMQRQAEGAGTETQRQAVGTTTSTAAPPEVGMRTTGNLKAVNFSFVESDDGPPRASAPYKPGEKVHLKYDTIDYSTDDQGQPKLLCTFRVTDPNGLPMYKPWTSEFARRMEPGAPVHWTFGFDLPSFVPAGAGKLVAQVRDQLNNAEVELTATFHIEAAPIAPAYTLEVRDFQLSLSAGGPPAEAPVVEGGGTVYMKCHLYGLQFRGDDAEAQIALRLVDPGGKVVLNKPDYLTVRDSWVYHPPTFRIPVSGHITLPSGSPRGVYREVYTITDNVANRTLMQEAKFEVK